MQGGGEILAFRRSMLPPSSGWVNDTGKGILEICRESKTGQSPYGSIGSAEVQGYRGRGEVVYRPGTLQTETDASELSSVSGIVTCIEMSSNNKHFQNIFLFLTSLSIGWNIGVQFPAVGFFSSSPLRQDRLRRPSSLLTDGYLELFPCG